MPTTAPSSAAERPRTAIWSWRRSGGLLAAGLLAVLVLYPVMKLALTALELGPGQVWEAIVSGRTLAAARHTLVTAALAAVLAVTAGLAAAMITERSGAPGRRWLRIGVLLPLLVPPYVAALSWMQAYGPAALTEDLVGLALPGLLGPVGVLLVVAVHAMPLAYLVLAAALRTRLDPDLERAARAAGATPFEAFRTITLPLLRPALGGAAALAFVSGANAFGIPAILGTPARFTTMTTVVYADLARSADPAAFVRVVVLSCALLVLTMTVVAGADRFTAARAPAVPSGAVRGPAPGGTADSPTGPGTSPAGAGGRAAALGLWVYLLLTTVLPLVALMLVAVTRAVGLSPTPPNWTLVNFGRALDASALAAFRNSLLLAATAAVIAVALGGLLATLRRTPSGRRFATAATLTFAVPGSALAVAVLLAYGPWLRDTLLLILIAYLAKFWALGHRPLAGSVDALPGDAVRAARASGAGPAAALFTVIAPLLRPALVSAWLLVFLFALHELTMSSLLHGPGSRTLAVVVLNVQQLGDIRTAAALAVLLTLAVLLAAAPLLASRRVTAWLGWSRDG